ncbi:dead-box atp-dependent rna helicase 20 [Quercus suber]|uniref:Dead-box atp-dependent rna helicase 20 n=1 Tax=Quercus suber TaxID=58331 RepID=A0AAW0K9L0_QUESU
MDGSRILIFMNTKEGCDQEYIHCIGRTGRARAKGTALTFFTAGNTIFAKELICILEEAVVFICMSVCTLLLKSTVSVNINQLDHGGFRDCGMGYGGGSTLYFVGNISMYY